MSGSIALLLLLLGGMSPTGQGYKQASLAINEYFHSHSYEYRTYMAACIAPPEILETAFMNEKEIHPSRQVAKSMAFMMCTWYRNEVASRN